MAEEHKKVNPLDRNDGNTQYQQQNKITAVQIDKYKMEQVSELNAVCGSPHVTVYFRCCATF